MSFTPQIGKRIEGEELKSFTATRQKMAVDATPKQKESLIFRAANKITDFVGARGIAEQFGSSIARTGLLLSGNKEAIKFVENPTLKEVVGSAIQTGSLLMPSGVGGSLLKKTALGGLMGQMSSTGARLQEGQDVTDAVKPSVQGAVGASVPLAGEAFRQMGKLLGKIGDKIQFTVIKPSQADVADGFSIENVKKYDLGGSLKTSFSKTEDKLRALSDELNTKLAESFEKVDLNAVFDKTAKTLMKNKANTFGSNAQVGNILDDLREEILSVADDGLVDVVNANTVKRASGHFGAWQFGMQDPTSNAREKVYNEFYKQIKTAIEEASPEGVQELNKQMSDIIPIMNALIRRIPIAERNSALSLGDIVTLTGAAVSPSAGFLTLANLASKSGTFGSAMSKAGTKIQGAESELVNLLTKLGVQSTSQQE